MGSWNKTTPSCKAVALTLICVLTAFSCAILTCNPSTAVAAEDPDGSQTAAAVSPSGDSADTTSAPAKAFASHAIRLDQLIQPVLQNAAKLCQTAKGILAIDPSTLPAETTLGPIELRAFGADAFFSAQPIPDSVFARMEGVTFPANCPVSRDELRYLRLLHVDAEGQVKVGEMVVNEAIADDVLGIFHQLYDAGYAIERVRLADDYGGSDEASMEDDNTSGFNCRPIEGSGEQSRHSYGMAIDVNTLYNPYYADWDGTVLPVTAGEYLDRSLVSPYTIEEGDLCCQLFAQYGFEWGGDWDTPKDYQHFER